MTDRDKRLLLILIGVALMATACLLFVFIETGLLDGIALVFLFVVGFGCCIAGTEPKKEDPF